MKAFIFILISLLGCLCVFSRQKIDDSNIERIKKPQVSTEKQKVDSSPESKLVSTVQIENRSEDEKAKTSVNIEEDFTPPDKIVLSPQPFSIPRKKPFDLKEFQKRDFSDLPDEIDDAAVVKREKFHWKPAMIQSGIFLGIQHAFRMTQEKTRRELDGPFFRDWGRSVRSLQGWSDGNKFFTNYVAHPLQGGVTGRIFINNSDRAKSVEFGKSLKYWETRLKTMAWSAVWSTQFEMGPISEATLGNVGINGNSKYNKMAWVDLVVTPIAGTGIVVAEDALDKYVLKNWLERKTSNKNMIKIYRVVFTPTYSLANILRGKMPWHRDDRSLGLIGNSIPGN